MFRFFIKLNDKFLKIIIGFCKKSLQISKKRGTKNLIICGTGLYQNNHFIRTIQNRCVIQLYYENLKLSVQSEKSPFRQFDFFGKLNFPT